MLLDPDGGADLLDLAATVNLDLWCTKAVARDYLLELVKDITDKPARVMVVVLPSRSGTSVPEIQHAINSH